MALPFPLDFCVANSHISGSSRLEHFRVRVSLFPFSCLGFTSHKRGKQDLLERGNSGDPQMQVFTLYISLYSKYKEPHRVEGDREAIPCHPREVSA